MHKKKGIEVLNRLNKIINNVIQKQFMASILHYNPATEMLHVSFIN